jgi:5'-3' exonuclease
MRGSIPLFVFDGVETDMKNANARKKRDDLKKKNEKLFENADKDDDKLKFFKRFAASQTGVGYYDELKIISLDEMGIQYVHAPREADHQLVS